MILNNKISILSCQIVDGQPIRVEIRSLPDFMTESNLDGDQVKYLFRSSTPSLDYMKMELLNGKEKIFDKPLIEPKWSLTYRQDEESFIKN
jgi:hypothetical protein